MLTYHDDATCSSSNDNVDEATWAEFVASVLGSALASASSGSNALEWGYSDECTYTGQHYSKVQCVSGALKVVYYSGENCLDDAVVVHTLDECVELTGDSMGSSVALSCRFDYDSCDLGSQTDSAIGNGYCDSDLNTEACNYDGGESQDCKSGMEVTPVKWYTK